MTFDSQVPECNGPQIKVFGVGGGGTNAVNTMVKSNIEGVEFIAANTDIQSLNDSLANKNIQIDQLLTRKGVRTSGSPIGWQKRPLHSRSFVQQVGPAPARLARVYLYAMISVGNVTVRYNL